MKLAQTALPEHLQRTMYSAMFGFSILFMIAIAYMLHYYRARFTLPDQP